MSAEIAGLLVIAVSQGVVIGMLRKGLRQLAAKVDSRATDTQVRVIDLGMAHDDMAEVQAAMQAELREAIGRLPQKRNRKVKGSDNG